MSIIPIGQRVDSQPLYHTYNGIESNANRFLASAFSRTSANDFYITNPAGINRVHGQNTQDYRADNPVVPENSDSVEISRAAHQKSAIAEATAWTELDPEEQARIMELEAVDRRVRAHEMAHIAAAGGYARGTNFSYTRGPNGRQYATGGEVKIDTSKVPGDPDATVRKAETIQRAALAPMDPSPQDRAVAARASMMATEARAELQMGKAKESQSNQSGDLIFPESTIISSSMNKSTYNPGSTADVIGEIINLTA